MVCHIGSLAPQDLERIRWYWEDFLDRPGEASRRTARETEERIQQLGAHLFEAVFSTSEAREVWDAAARRLPELRIEICDAACDPSEPPWELLWDPKRQVWPAAACASFVRRPQTRVTAPAAPGGGPLRILAVLSPPDRTGASAFRSAYRRLSEKRGEAGAEIEWSLLRPPTLARLSSALLEAEAMEKPFHVVHFEGSGVFLDANASEALPRGLAEASFPAEDDRGAGPSGYLLFDHAQDSSRLRLVSALDLAQLMGESRTPIVSLTNCCERPVDGATALPLDAPKAFHSIASELSALSAISVIQTPYRLDPETVAKMYGKIYETLADGHSVGRAAAAVRADAAESPSRVSVFERTERQDAPVLRVHEAHPVAIIDSRRSEFLTDGGQYPQQATQEARHARGDSPLPNRPRGGCFGLDGLLVDLDRLFTGTSCVLLSGEAGSGKTVAAAEYARWLRASDGVDGPTVYTSVEEVSTVDGLIERLTATFAEPLASNGYAWQRMNESERLETTLFALNQIPALWIWDDFQSIRKGGRRVRWTEEEIEKLHGLLEKLSETQVRMLIVSRDSEQWLKVPLRRRRLTGLPLRERLLVARSLMQSLHFPTREFERWMPLVEASKGNPMLLRLLVRQALHESLAGSGDFGGFLGRMLGPEENEGGGLATSEPLPKALQYVIERGFGETERNLLSLAHVFGRVIDLDVLALMAERDGERALADLHARAAATIIEERPGSGFERAADIGLLRLSGPRRYVVEPALASRAPKLFRGAFGALDETRESPTASRSTRFAGSMAALASRTGLRMPSGGEAGAAGEGGEEQAAAAAIDERGAGTAPISQAFVEACSAYGRHLALSAELDETQTRAALAANEQSFLRAIEIACEHGWWGRAAGSLEALGELYEGSGYTTAWNALVERLKPFCTDADGRKPLDGREALWRPLAEQQVRLATARGATGWAIEVQRLAVDWDRKSCGGSLNKDIREVSDEDREALLSLARSLNRLGVISRSDAAPIDDAESEAFEICEALGQHERAAGWAFDLGSDYSTNAAIQNLVKAEHWLRRGLDLLGEKKEGASRFLAALGQTAWHRFRAARSRERPEAELVRHLTDARQYFERAIENAPAYNHEALAQYNQLYGHVSYSLGDIDRALPHYREAIRHDQLLGNALGAAKTRFNLAIALRDIGRLGEARKYATAAFDNIKEVEDPATEHLLDRARRLVDNIEQRLESVRNKRKPAIQW